MTVITGELFCSFIVSFSFYAANPENDSKKLQDFLVTMEDAIRDHPLWVGATEEEIDSAMEVIICCDSPGSCVHCMSL